MQLLTMQEEMGEVVVDLAVDPVVAALGVAVEVTGLADLVAAVEAETEVVLEAVAVVLGVVIVADVEVALVETVGDLAEVEEDPEVVAVTGMVEGNNRFQLLCI